ncbi:MAG: hypothetical protein HY240_00370 [Actinobacteria bacterium]|nr:hypothetical protein [Actinomycetota bacterium]
MFTTLGGSDWVSSELGDSAAPIVDEFSAPWVPYKLAQLGAIKIIANARLRVTPFTTPWHDILGLNSSDHELKQLLGLLTPT